MRGIGLWLGISAVCLLLASAAQAQARELHVVATGDGCPSADLVVQALEPLLDDVAVTTGTGALTATVADDGDEYAVEIRGATRELDDDTRDCVERARVAAVFIALNFDAPAQPSDGDDEAALQIGAALFGAAAYAPAIDRGAPGLGVALWLQPSALRFELSAGLVAGASIELERVAGMSGRVELTRVPFAVSASYLFDLGALQLGPTLGLQVDVLRMRGEGVDRPQTSLRANPGGVAGLDLHLRFSSALLGLFQLAVAVFPRAYELEAPPLGTLGDTPQVWLGARLGLEWRIQ